MKKKEIMNNLKEYFVNNGSGVFEYTLPYRYNPYYKKGYSSLHGLAIKDKDIIIFSTKYKNIKLGVCKIARIGNHLDHDGFVELAKVLNDSFKRMDGCSSNDKKIYGEKIVVNEETGDMTYFTSSTHTNVRSGIINTFVSSLLTLCDLPTQREHVVDEYMRREIIRGNPICTSTKGDMNIRLYKDKCFHLKDVYKILECDDIPYGYYADIKHGDKTKMIDVTMHVKVNDPDMKHLMKIIKSIRNDDDKGTMAAIQKQLNIMKSNK